MLLGVVVLLAPVLTAVYLLRTTEVPSAASRLGYVLSDIRGNKSAVPRVYFDRLPAELVSLNSARERKSLFIRIMLPLILRVNDDIRADRARLETLYERHKQGVALPDRDRAWLADLAREYGLAQVDYEELMLRVDRIPPSIALAQAAIESGWGTSRFAQQGNAIFGQWTYDGSGLVPQGRDAGLTHRIKAFDALWQSVAAYARNLNSHKSYDAFRRIRARRGNALGLAATLDGYSERGMAYIRDLHSIIRANGLLDFDRTSLEKTA